ncbi:TolC family protein [Geobacter argillaceus]|nr:TolC family protein [Geobacter argillaceus]
MVPLFATGNGQCATIPNGMNLSRLAAVEMAIRRNIDVRNEALNAVMADTDAVRSRALYDPLLSTSASRAVSSFPGETFGVTSTNASVGLTQYLPTGGSIAVATQTGYTNADSQLTGVPSKNWQSSAGISISQPLLKNAGKETTELSITLAANTRKDSIERFRLYVTDTVVAVITSYNRLYSLRQTLESRVAALGTVQNLLEEIKKTKPGPKQRLDIANVEYALSQRRKELVDAERNVRDQEASLQYLIGMETKTQLIPTDPPARDEPPETEEQAVKMALELRPDLKQLRLALKASELQERVARHQSLPDLSVTASGGFSGIAGAVGSTYQQIGDGKGRYWSAGLQFSVPLGNTAAVNDYRKSKIRTEQAQNQIRALEWKIRNDVEADMRALISARLQLQTTERSRLYAEQRREEYQKHTRAGTTSVQDVINAENDLTSARNAHQDATEAFAYAVAKLWRDMGSLLDHQGVRVDTAHPEKMTEGTGMAASFDAVPPANQTVVAEPDPLRTTVNGLMGNPVGSGVKPAVLDAPRAQGAVPSVDDGRRNPSPPATMDKSMVRNGDKAGKTGSAVKAASYTLMIGEYAGKPAMADAKNKIKSAGLSPLVKPGPKKKVSMIRLLIGGFPDQKSARKELSRLRNITADCFILMDENRQYRLYAGTYRDEKGAAQEQARLAAHGIRSSRETAIISVSTLLLTAGSYPTREAALKGAARLEGQGVPSVVTENL